MVSLVDTLEPATIATSGRAGSQRLAQRIELGRQQRAGAGDRRVLRDAVRGGFGAMRGAESVIHIDVAQLRHLLREFVAVLFLALVDAAVFQQHHLAGLDVDAIDPVLLQLDRLAQQLRQALRDRCQRIRAA